MKFLNSKKSINNLCLSRPWNIWQLNTMLGHRWRERLQVSSALRESMSTFSEWSKWCDNCRTWCDRCRNGRCVLKDRGMGLTLKSQSQYACRPKQFICAVMVWTQFIKTECPSGWFPSRQHLAAVSLSTQLSSKSCKNQKCTPWEKVTKRYWWNIYILDF